ncbi:MAG TPA: TetR/AcrR family transcriptional regulator [Syntrophales bacterium]|nr:TetR/AcrR family transcriptional regulator [Syntrophales bacterium]HPQ44402.1 TetR/AcrR family transcriptional regulator [Syntrophales bacterium]
MNGKNKPVNKRKKILKAAATVFSQKGFHQATMDEIAKEAEVAKGTLYYTFTSKSKLFAATVTEGMEEIIGEVEKELTSELPFKEHFRKLIRTNFLLYLKYRDLSTIVFNELTSGVGSDVLEEIGRVRQRYVDFISDLLDEGHKRGYLKEVNDTLAAVGVIGFLDGLCNYYLKGNGHPEQEAFIDTMFTVLSSGLLEHKGIEPT